MKTTKSLLGILTITAALAVQVQAQSFLTNGLVAYYPFNGNANDASGNGNNGVPENTYSTTNLFGFANSAMGFSGNSWVYIPYSASMATTNFSVSMMFNAQTNYVTGFSGNFCLLRSGAGQSPSDFYNGYEIAPLDLGQNFGFWDFDGLSDYGPGKCVTPISKWHQNTWYNLIFTQNGTNAQFYVNGVLVASATNTTLYVPAQSSPFYIGSNASGTSNPTAVPSGMFTGIIYDVRFYNRGLSSSEVQQLNAYESAPIVSLQKAVYLTCNNLWAGSNYQVQASSDLINWTNQGSVFMATNSSWSSTNYWNVSNWNQLFFRLQLAP